MFRSLHSSLIGSVLLAQKAKDERQRARQAQDALDSEVKSGPVGMYCCINKTNYNPTQSSFAGASLSFHGFWIADFYRLTGPFEIYGACRFEIRGWGRCSKGRALHVASRVGEE
jgi:hypothetical protein